MIKKEFEMNQVEAVVSYFGSRGKLAKALGVTPPAISRWKEFIPDRRAYQIEVLTEGKFKAEQLKKERRHG